MNVPINCPICGDPLINTFNDSTDLVFYKSCRRRPSHIFSCAIFKPGFFNTTDYEVVERVAFTLSMSPMLSVEINPREKVMFINKCPPNASASIAEVSFNKLSFYVEPDFSDYKKLVSKIKTYLLFS